MSWLIRHELTTRIPPASAGVRAGEVRIKDKGGGEITPFFIMSKSMHLFESGFEL